MVGFALANELYSITFPSSKSESEALCASNQQDYVFLDGPVSQRCVTSWITWEPWKNEHYILLLFRVSGWIRGWISLRFTFWDCTSGWFIVVWTSYAPRVVFLSWLKPSFSAKEMAKVFLRVHQSSVELLAGWCCGKLTETGWNGCGDYKIL